MSRDKILDAAATVFSKSGFHLASMDEIAKTAGVAKGTLYYHFPGKSELFKTMITEALDFIISEVQKDFSDTMSITEQLKKVLDRNISFYVQYKELASIFLNGIGTGIDPDTLEEISKLKKRYIDFIADLLREGNRGGFIVKIDYNLTAAGIIGLLDSMCKYCLRYDGNVDLPLIRDTMYNIITSGLMEKRP